MRDPKILPINKPNTTSGTKVGIRCSSLCFESKSKTILSNLSVSFSKFGISAIMGPNGAGKSVLMRTIIGLLEPTSGFVQIDPEFVNKTAMVFQRPVLIRRSVYGNLSHALAIARYPKQKRKKRITELLALGGLIGMEKTPARQLSGGEQQRLQLVRALASDPKLILLDEPSASLDPQSTLAIEQIISSTAEKRTKLLLVTHNIGQAKRLADDVTFIHKGSEVEQNNSVDFFHNPTSPLVKSYLDGELLV